MAQKGNISCSENAHMQQMIRWPRFRVDATEFGARNLLTTFGTGAVH